MAVMNYRTQDGRADYGFSIEFRPTKVGGFTLFRSVPGQRRQQHATSLPSLRPRTASRGLATEARNLGDARTILHSGPSWPSATTTPKKKKGSTPSRPGDADAANKKERARARPKIHTFRGRRGQMQPDHLIAS